MEIILITLLGLCFGSFVTMASHRLPRDMGVVRARSHCPQCKTCLGARDLFPLLSWALSGAKCRHCKARVSLRYPLTELVCAGLFLLVYFSHGLHPQAGVLMLLAVALLTMLVADLETGLVPDEIHFFLLPLGIAYQGLQGADWADVALCALLSLGLGLLLHYGYFWLRGRHGLGLGDVKFLGVAGVWLADVRLFTVFLVLSGVLGIVSGVAWKILREEPRFPFGPALAVSLFALLCFPEANLWFWQGLAALLTG